MCPGYQTSDVEKFDGDGAPAVDARAVVGTTFVSYGEAGASAGDLEVTNCALGVDGCEAE